MGGLVIGDPSAIEAHAARQRAGVERFLSATLDATVAVTDLSRPTATGFSADTFIVDVNVDPADAAPFTDAGGAGRLVVQAAPTGPALFEDYDLARTFRVQQALAPFDVPTAPVRWLCEDESWLGAPFYVMDFVAGRVPPDRPPYHVGGWLFDADIETRATIWSAGVEAMGALHAVPVDGFSFLAEADMTDRSGRPDRADAAGQRLDRWRRFGAELEEDAEPSLLAALDRLAVDRPDPGPLSVHWGDGKLGNMIFDEGRTAAILDWELCGLSVAEEDLAHWLAVDWFLSTAIGNQRLPGLPTTVETVSHYESVTGRSTTGVDWWFAFALVRMGLIFQRAAVQSRRRRGGDGALRPNVIVPHIERLLDGTTWSDYGDGH